MSTIQEEAIVRLGLNTSKLQGEMQSFGRNFTQSLKSFASEWGAALTVGGIVAGVNHLLTKFDELQDRADNLNVSTDFLQGMQHIARLDAVGGVKSFDRAITDLGTKLGQAKSGNEEALKSFNKWGISGEEIRTLNLEQMFYRVSDAIQATNNPSVRLAASFELLGKGGKNLNGVLAQGSEELLKRIAAVEKLNKENIKQLAHDKAVIEESQNSAEVFFGKVFLGLNALVQGSLGPFQMKRWFQNIREEAQRNVAKRRDEEFIAAQDVVEEKWRLQKEYDAKLRRQHQDQLTKQLADLRVLTDAKLHDLERERVLKEKFNSGRFMPTHEELLKSRFGNIVRRQDFLEQDIVQSKLAGNLGRARAGMAEYQRLDARLDYYRVKDDPNKAMILEFQKLTNLTFEGALKVLIKNAD